MSGRHKWADIRRKSGGRGSRDIRITGNNLGGLAEGEMEMNVKAMKEVSKALMGNGRVSENPVAHMWAATAEICDRIEKGAGAGFRDYKVDPRTLRKSSMTTGETPRPSRWSRIRDWFKP
jgi:hypothetical protein